MPCTKIVTLDLLQSSRYTLHPTPETCIRNPRPRNFNLQPYNPKPETLDRIWDATKAMTGMADTKDDYLVFLAKRLAVMPHLPNP